MINITCHFAIDMPVYMAEQCADRLCWKDSEMQGVFRRIAARALQPSEHGWQIGCAWKWDEVDEIVVVAWVSVTDWRVANENRVQVQGFVAKDMRRRGLASAIVACLAHDMPKTELPIAVFSDRFFAIARRAGWKATQYKSLDDGWIAVAHAGGGSSGRGSDPAGVHAAAPEVRGVPLARDEEGEAT